MDVTEVNFEVMLYVIVEDEFELEYGGATRLPVEVVKYSSDEVLNL